MKSCPYCLQTDLGDEATKCPHCGEWLKRRALRPLRLVAEVIGWVFLTIFVVGLAGCGFMAVTG